MRNASDILRSIEHQFLWLQAEEGCDFQREDAVLYISNGTMQELRRSPDFFHFYKAEDLYTHYMNDIRLYRVDTAEDIAHVCKKPSTL